MVKFENKYAERDYYSQSVLSYVIDRLLDIYIDGNNSEEILKLLIKSLPIRNFSVLTVHVCTHRI